MEKLEIGKKVLNLSIFDYEGKKWNLFDEKSSKYHLLFFFSGIHNNESIEYLKEIENNVQKLKNFDIEVYAITTQELQRTRIILGIFTPSFRILGGLKREDIEKYHLPFNEDMKELGHTAMLIDFSHTLLFNKEYSKGDEIDIEELTRVVEKIEK